MFTILSKNTVLRSFPTAASTFLRNNLRQFSSHATAQNKVVSGKNAPPTLNRNISISNLHENTIWTQVRDVVLQHAGVDCKVDITGDGKGRIRFSSADDAIKAAECINGVEVNGKPIVTHGARATGSHRSNSPKKQPRSYPVYINFIPAGTSWQDIKDLCREYGTISYSQVFDAPEGASHVSAIVRFATQRQAHIAAKFLSGFDYKGAKLHARAVLKDQNSVRTPTPTDAPTDESDNK